MKISLHEPRITQNDIALVVEALESQWVSTGGPFITQFESELAQYSGFKHGVAVCNGSAGLMLAIDLVRRERKITGAFHVIVPTLSFAATWNAVILSGGVPIPVDTAPGNVNISAASIELTLRSDFYSSGGRLVHNRTQLPLLSVLPAHILGWVHDMDKIAALCELNQLELIEDAAESLGTRYLDGSHVGQHGRCAVVSFNGNKILTTGGGGMLLTNDTPLAQRAKHLSTTAKIDNIRYVHDEPGYNFRMVNVLAALGVSQLGSLQSNIDKKRTINSWYRNNFKGSSIVLYEQDTCLGNNWLNTVQFTSNSGREKAMERLHQVGVDARPLWTPFHRLRYCEKSVLNQDGYPNADQVWQTFLSLPSSPDLTKSQVDHICEVVLKLDF
jgi:perosamine synthetase